MCRGNMGHGMADGGYDAIAERLFQRLDVDGYFLEYDTPRAGDFEPLRFVPKGKRVAIGIVSTKNAEVETADALKRAHRRGRPLDRSRPALPLPAVRLFQQRRHRHAFRSTPSSASSLASRTWRARCGGPRN